MYSINHCMSVKTVLCARSKKLVNEKNLLPLCTFCFVSQRWLHHWQGSRTPIFYGECFTSLIPPPVYFFIYVYFFSAKLSRFCPGYLTQANQHLTSSAYSPFNLFSTTFLVWGNSSNGICKKVVPYFLSKIFQKAFYKQ